MPIVIVVTLATFLLFCLGIIAAELFSGRAMRPVGRRREADDDIPGEPAVVAMTAPAIQPVAVREPVIEQPVTPAVAADAPKAGPATAAKPAEGVSPVTADTETEAKTETGQQFVHKPLPVHRMQAEAGRFREPAAGVVPAARLVQKSAPAVAPATDVETAAVVAEPVVVTAETAKPAEAGDDAAFTVASVAHYLQRHAVPLAVAMSPAGDQGSTTTVMLARTVAEEGRSVVLVDLTGTACPSRLMAEDARLPGITDLLCGEAAFGDAIHRDRLSDAHIIPQGASDPATAMRGIDRLTMILDALVDAYDLVLVECGAAEISGLKRLIPSGDADIVLSAPGYSDEQLASQILAFEAAGYSNILVISETGDAGTPLNGRPRAA